MANDEFVQVGVEYRHEDDDADPLSAEDRERKRMRLCNGLKSVMFQTTVASGDSDFTDVQQRKSSYEWGIAYQNALFVSTGKGLHNFVVDVAKLLDYSSVFSDPETLDALHVCIDQGSDGWCMVQALSETSCFICWARICRR